MNNNVDKQYLDGLKFILDKGIKKSDRTGTGTISIFGMDMRFDMREGFPLLTSKKMFIKGIIHELIWFLKGDTNIKYLLDNDVHIWDGDAYKNYEKWVDSENKRGSDSASKLRSQGKRVKQYYLTKLTKDEFIDKIKNDSDFSKKWGDLGPIYGKQWRNWEGIKKVEIAGPGLVSPQFLIKSTSIDQIKKLIDDLRNNPDSRRLMVSAWNPGEVDSMVLPPCHYGFQCWTREMSLEERLEWYLNKKNESIEDLSHHKLDSLRVPKRYLSLKWTQRSVDSCLGLPYNIASYGFLLHLLAKEVNMEPLDLIFSGGDCHIYLNQIEGAQHQINQQIFDLPKLTLTNDSIESLKYENIIISDYKFSPSIKYQLSN